MKKYKNGLKAATSKNGPGKTVQTAKKKKEKKRN